MTTTIQINDRTLDLLKKVKEETNSASYDETIKKIILKKMKKESLACYLGRKPFGWIMNDLRDKHDRF